MTRKSAAQRQRECRSRKRTTGKYVTVFVPGPVVKKLGARPSNLVKYFLQNSQLIEIILEKEKESRALKQKLKEIMGQSRKIEEELAKIYSNERVRGLFDVQFDEKHRIRTEQIIELTLQEEFALLKFHRIEMKDFQDKAKGYAYLLKNELAVYSEALQEVKDEFIRLTIHRRGQWEEKEIDLEEAKSAIIKLRTLCRNALARKMEFDTTEKGMFSRLFGE
jgi:hypothetical protein